jgi:hypothetical protein
MGVQASEERRTTLPSGSNGFANSKPVVMATIMSGPPENLVLEQRLFTLTPQLELEELTSQV